MNRFPLNILVLCVSPLLALSPASVPAQTAPQAAPAAAELSTSAHHGLLQGLRTLQGIELEGHIQVLAASSEYIEATAQAKAKIAVEFDVRVHSSSGASAQAAFGEIEKTLAALPAAAPSATPSYADAVELLVTPKFDAGSFDRPGTGTHRALVQVHYPAGTFSNAIEATAEKELSKSMPAALRAQAAHRQVKMGALKISVSERALETGQRQDWNVTQFKSPKKEAAPITRTQVANFLQKLEELSDRVFISKVTLGGIEGKHVGEFSVSLSTYSN